MTQSSTIPLACSNPRLGAVRKPRAGGDSIEGPPVVVLVWQAPARDGTPRSRECGSERRGWRNDACGTCKPPHAPMRFLLLTLLGASLHVSHSSPFGTRIQVLAFPSNYQRLQSPTLVSRGYVDCGADHAVDYSFRVGPLLRESPPGPFSSLVSSGVQWTCACGPIQRLGQVDLATNVDFTYLTKVIKGTGPCRGNVILYA